MENLEKIEGKYYTQNVDQLPIEKRVFFSQGKVANVEDYRLATEEEIENWYIYQKKMEEEMNLNNEQREELIEEHIN